MRMFLNIVIFIVFIMQNSCSSVKTHGHGRNPTYSDSSRLYGNSEWMKKTPVSDGFLNEDSWEYLNFFISGKNVGVFFMHVDVNYMIAWIKETSESNENIDFNNVGVNFSKMFMRYQFEYKAFYFVESEFIIISADYDALKVTFDGKKNVSDEIHLMKHDAVSDPFQFPQKENGEGPAGKMGQPESAD